MVSRTVVACDICHAEPAETLVLDLGDGPRSLDICSEDANKFAVLEFLNLVAEGGHAADEDEAPARAKSNPKETPAACPVCGRVLANRSLVLRHLMAPRTHGYSMADATRVLGPAPSRAGNEPVTCRLCGALTTRGPGFSRHLVNQHPGTDYATELEAVLQP